MQRDIVLQNLREAFFQAVSNSSWANEGYLVAAKIADDEAFLSELRRLSSSFGVGVIRLRVDDPDRSDVMFPAREKLAIDWETLNSLARCCKDVEELLKTVSKDAVDGNIQADRYDQVFGLRELRKMLRGKQ